jgi:hypothetical protein
MKGLLTQEKLASGNELRKLKKPLAKIAYHQATSNEACPKPRIGLRLSRKL